MLEFRRSLLAATWAGVLVLAGTLAPVAVAAPSSACADPLTVLVDRSGSMATHDPFGELRLAVGEALERLRPARDVDVIVPFAEAAGSPVAATSGDGWPGALGQALSGDRGSTSIEALLERAGAGDAGGRIVVTDGEAVLRGVVPGLRAWITVGGAADSQTARVVRESGGVVLEIASPQDAPPALARWCAEPRRPADVVLIGGLATTVRGTIGARSRAQCARADGMRAWCAWLVQRGWRVSAVPMSPGGAAVLDSRGRLKANGAALRRWLARVAPREPMLIGHSMGGLIAHAAIRVGASAGGLITVGTPHAGSYGADAYAAARLAAAGCPALCPPPVVALAGAAAIVRLRYGVALDDLTRIRRTVQDRLGAPGVPTATWAGVPNASVGPVPMPMSMSLGRGEYLVPNDGIVGRGSATGRLAGLTPEVVVADGQARHSAAVPPLGAPTELESPAVARWIAEVAERFAAEEPRAARAAWSAPRRRLSRRPVVVALRSSAALEPGGPAVGVAPDAVVVSTAPIGLLCDGAPVEPIETWGGLWFLDVGAMGCSRLTGRPDRAVTAEAVVVGVASGRPGGAPEAELEARRVRGGWRVVIRLHGQFGRPELIRAGRRIALRPASGDEWGARRWVARLPARGATRVLARVRMAGRSDLVGETVLP